MTVQAIGISGSGHDSTNDAPHTSLGCVSAYAMLCLPGKDAGIHIDAVMSIRRHELVDGDTIHQEMVCCTVVSDVEPFAGANIAGKWEDNHADRTRSRLLGALGKTGLRFWNGRAYEGDTWQLDDVDAMTTGKGAYTITLTFSAERPPD